MIDFPGGQKQVELCSNGCQTPVKKTLLYRGKETLALLSYELIFWSLIFLCSSIVLVM